MPQTLLINDAARVLGMSRRSVYYRIRDGRLATIRTKCGSRRVLVSSIEELLREMSSFRSGDQRSAEPEIRVRAIRR